MCDACAANGTAASGRTQRYRIWELDPLWHCTVVGTCLTLGDLRELVRKLRYRVNLKTVSDYELHSHFVGKAGTPERASKLLNKLLDRKHAPAIRKFSQAKTTEELKALWQAAFSAGDIPGPLWATTSHPALTLELGTKIYGDVHMLSHLVGAANRADVRVLHKLEQDNAELLEKLAREKRRTRKRTDQHRQAIAQLENERARSHRAEEQTQRLESVLARRGDHPNGQAPAHEPESAAVETLRAALAEQSARAERLAAELDDTQRREAALAAECAALEQVLHREEDDTGVVPAGEPGCPFDLDGRCILYVGGRSNTVCRLRSLVRQWNGEFLHHDGGLEKSIDELASAVTRADTVVFPTDCISHQAVRKLKQMCRRNMKPFVPLRSAGLSSFVAGLRNGIDTEEPPPAGPQSGR